MRTGKRPSDLAIYLIVEELVSIYLIVKELVSIKEYMGDGKMKEANIGPFFKIFLMRKGGKIGHLNELERKKPELRKCRGGLRI